MPARLTLLCCTATATARAGGFADPAEPLDEGGRVKAAARRRALPAATRIEAGPGIAARETAAALGLNPIVADALADMRWGRWSGRSLAEVHHATPDALAAWLADPTAGTPGGETFAALSARVAPWLAAIAATHGSIVAITHAMPIRALLATALGVSAPATLRIDLAPLCAVTLSFDRQWRLRGLGPWPPG